MRLPGLGVVRHGVVRLHVRPEQGLEDERVLELRSCRVPSILIVRHVHGVVHEDHLVVGGLVLERVPESLGVRRNIADQLRRGVRDLDRVRLDVGDREPALLHEVLEIHHEQGPALRDDVVRIVHRVHAVRPVGEAGRREAVHAVDGDLQREGQSLVVLADERHEGPVQEPLGSLDVVVLDRHAPGDQILEPGRVPGAEALHGDQRVRVHRGDVEQGDVLVISRLGVDVSALADDLVLVRALAVLVPVSREETVQIRVNERRLAVVPEYDLTGELIRRRVDVQTRELSQDLPRLPVGRVLVEHSSGGADVVLAVLDDARDVVPQDLLVPWDVHLHVRKAEVDLPLLQGLLLGAEVVHVGVRRVIGVPEERAAVAVDDPLRQVVQALVVVAHPAGVQNMVVVALVVEPDEPHVEQGLDLLGLRIDHGDDFRVVIVSHPAHEEQVLVHLHVVEDEGSLPVLLADRGLRLLGGLEPELSVRLEARVLLVRAPHGEGEDRPAHVLDVVLHARLVGVIEDLLDEVHRGLGSRMDLLPKIPLDQLPQGLLAAHLLLTENIAFLSLAGEPLRDGGDGQPVGQRAHPSERGPPPEDFDLDPRRDLVRQLRDVTCVPVVQVDPGPGLADLGVGLGETQFPRRIAVRLEGLLAVVPADVEVDDDHVLRRSHVVQAARVEVIQNR